MLDLPHIRGLVLDLDDTLYPEIDFVRSGFRAVAHAHAGLLGDAAASIDLMWRIFNEADRTRVFNLALQHLGLTADAATIAALVQTYRAHSPRISLHPDADRLLARAQGRLLLGIVSDGPLETQQRKVDALVLQPRVHAVELTDLYGREFWKPHPRAFESVARFLGCPHRELAYVGDNPEKDFIAPNRLGWTTIRIRRTDGIYRDRAAPPGGEPRFEIDTLDEI